MRPSPTLRTLAVGLAALLITPLLSAAAVADPLATTSDDPPVETLDWSTCEEVFECATLTVPLDHDEPDGDTLDLALVRRPARDTDARVGTLITNPGGPGGSGVDFVLGAGADDGFLAPLNERFDLVSWDPRGTKGSSPIDCDLDVDVEPFGAFPALDERDRIVEAARAYAEACVDSVGADLLASVSTLDTARDMELIRLALGEEHLTYLGFSYGTYLGATYAAVYPDRVRAFVLDGAVDPDAYANDPLVSNAEQAVGFETALTRYFDICDVGVCRYLGDERDWRRLVARLDAAPLETGDPARPVTGEDVLNATLIVMYSRQAWPILDLALAEAAAGDGARIKFLSDIALGIDDDGSVDPGADAFPAITAIDAAYPTDIALQDQMYWTYLQSSPSFGPSTFWASTAGGYAAFEWPVEADDRFTGPFTYDADGGPPIVVIGTTFDPATPFRGSIAMTEQLGDATLLTMVGDGHTAYGGNSTCIDDAVGAFLVDLVEPEPGTICEQELATAGAAVVSDEGTGVAPADVIGQLRRFAGISR